MRKALLTCVLLIFGAACAWAQGSTGISPADIKGPTEFCKVTKEPDPVLLGGWQCEYENYVSKLSTTRTEPVQYYLVKQGDKYAVYFYRFKAGVGNEYDKVYRGWREFTINGSEIVSETGVRFFARDGEVFYSWQNDKPVKMTKLGF